MNIEGVTLLNQFIQYSPLPLALILVLIISTILIAIGIIEIQDLHEWGVFLLIGGLIIFIVFMGIASTNDSKTFLNYPDYIHYIIQIDDKAAWSEIAPNYKIIKEIYPDTGIYEIEKEYSEE